MSAADVPPQNTDARLFNLRVNAIRAITEWRKAADEVRMWARLIADELADLPHGETFNDRYQHIDLYRAARERYIELTPTGDVS